MSIINANWVLLPSENKSSKIGMYVDTNDIVFNDFKTDIVRGNNYDVYITVEQPIRVGDWGVGYQVGLFGVDAKHYLFYNDGSPTGKINAVCKGARKVVASTNRVLGCGDIKNDFLKSLVINFNSIYKTRPNKGSGDVLIDFDDNQQYFNNIKIGILFNEITDNKPTFTAYTLDRKLIIKNAPQSELYALPRVDSDGTVNLKLFKTQFNLEELEMAYNNGFRNGRNGELNVTSFNEWFFNKFLN